MPDRSPLLTPAELAGLLATPGGPDRIRVCDVRWYLAEPGRGRREYETAHIPGAMFIDMETVLAAPTGAGRHPLPDPTTFARALAERGIGRDHIVVAYDDPGATLAAARLWWMLDDLGHPDVRVLDGGFAAWRASGAPVSTDIASYPPATLDLADAWSKVIDREKLKPRLGEVTVLDGRAPERYRGEVEPIDPVPGHIPTAISAPIGGNLEPDGRFKDSVPLRQRYATLGAEGGDVVTSCGSGVNACHTALAMRLAGLPDPILYAGSYSDWSRAGEPIATGPLPGDPPEATGPLTPRT